VIFTIFPHQEITKSGQGKHKVITDGREKHGLKTGNNHITAPHVIFLVEKYSPIIV